MLVHQEAPLDAAKAFLWSRGNGLKEGSANKPSKFGVALIDKDGNPVADAEIGASVSAFPEKYNGTHSFF